MSSPGPLRRRFASALPPAALGLLAAAMLAGCGLLAPTGPLPGQTEPGGPVLTPAQKEAEAALPEPVRQISPQTPAVRAYRRLGAGHIYQRYASRIYKGMMPPLVYAVVVVETHLDASGNVEQVTLMRAPDHAPEVSLEIIELIKAASPLPSPGKIGAHTYVDTWLWDKSGRFQLDTLTQGQRSR